MNANELQDALDRANARSESKYQEARNTEMYGPRYNVGSSALTAWRRKCSGGLSDLTHEQVQAYGTAVEEAVLKSQHAKQQKAPLPKPYSGDGWEDTHAATLQRHASEAAAWTRRKREGRADRKVEEAYREAMKAKQRGEDNASTKLQNRS